MADVNISKYRASVVRDGSKPASPGFVVSEGQDPVDPAGTGQNHLPVTIAPTATGLSITDSQILSGAGTVGQYIRGDGSLADFPSASGGGSSVSYYLNGSVNQGTIGGVAYKELSKVPVLGTGTDFSINANGYIASFITDAGDPNLLEIPGGNWNFETYFSASSSGGTPTFYVELYKYDGTTFTLLASNSGSPELIAFGTTLTSYFSTLAVPTTTLALTDRLAIRYYVNHSGRTITMHTEDNHLCQVITTFTTGLTALNGLTAQVQNFAVGTSGTDFNISSATATHTFNLPTASATNRGALSSADWSTFNNKQNALGYVPVPETRTLTINGTAFDLSANRSWTVGDVRTDGSYSNPSWITALAWSKITGTPTTLSGYGITDAVPNSRTITINGVTQDLSANRSFNVGTVTSVGLSSATSGVTIGSTPVTSSGTITLAIATASGSQNGLLSSTDWTTFNNKQNALTNPVTGTGTTNYLAKFTGSTTIGNSQVFDNGTFVGIGTGGSSIGNDFVSVFFNSSTARSQAINIKDTNASASGSTFEVYRKSDDTYLGNIRRNGTDDAIFVGGNSYLALGSGNTERLRITSGGNLLVGTTSDNGARMQVSGTATFSGAYGTSSGVYLSGSTYGTYGANRGATSASAGMGYFSVGSQRWFTGIYENSDNFGFYSVGTNGFPLILNYSTGAATFSSSVTAGGDGYFSSTSGTNRVRSTNTGTTGFSASAFEMFAHNGSSVAYGGGMFQTNSTFVYQQIAANQTNIYGFQSGGMRLATGTAPIIFATGNADLDFSVARFTISSTGFVSAGATTNGRLGVRGFTNDSSGYAFEAANASGNTLFIVRNDGISTFSSNVGIGTTSPTTLLQVEGSAPIFTMNRTSGGFINRINFSSGGTNYASIISDAGAGEQRYSIGPSAGWGGYHTFYTDTTERMRITSGGNLLVGTTSDNGARLQVSGSIHLLNGGNRNIRIGSATNYYYDLQTTNDDFQIIEAGSTPRLTIKYPNGNVGIGTSSPGQKLEVNGRIRVTTNGSNGGDMAVDAGGLAFSAIGATPITFQRSDFSAESMRITGGGNVLIGTTTDNSHKLRVNGTGYFDTGIKTGNPVGSTTNDWLLGRALVTGTSTPDRWIRVQIGNLYYDILAVYMGSV